MEVLTDVFSLRLNAELHGPILQITSFQMHDHMNVGQCPLTLKW